MANTNAPFGMLSFGRRDGGSPTAGLTRVWIASSDPNPVFTGDLVAYSSANNNYVTWASTGAGGVDVRGVFMGCEFYSATIGRVVWSRYFPGSVATSADVTAYIIDDPDQLFIIQTSSAAAGSSMIGYNFTVTPSSQGSTLTGQSVMTLNSSVVLGSTNSTYPVRMVDVYSNYAPPGANGTTNSSFYNIVVVAPNAWDRKILTGATT